jgi:hypothetical protein
MSSSQKACTLDMISRAPRHLGLLSSAGNPNVDQTHSHDINGWQSWGHDANDEATIRDNMTHVFCGTRHAAIADWWRRCDRTAMFGRCANTWLIITKTDRQNSLPITPKSGIIRKNRNPNNSRFFPTRQSPPIIPNFSREARQTMGSHLVESCSIFEVFPRNAKFPTFAECPRLKTLSHGKRKFCICFTWMKVSHKIDLSTNGSRYSLSTK